MADQVHCRVKVVDDCDYAAGLIRQPEGMRAAPGRRLSASNQIGCDDVECAPKRLRETPPLAPRSAGAMQSDDTLPSGRGACRVEWSSVHRLVFSLAELI